MLDCSPSCIRKMLPVSVTSMRKRYLCGFDFRSVKGVGGESFYEATHKSVFKINHASFKVTCGTVFHGTKIPLQKWFIAIALIMNAKKSLSSHQLSRDLDMNQKSA